MRQDSVRWRTCYTDIDEHMGMSCLFPFGNSMPLLRCNTCMACVFVWKTCIGISVSWPISADSCFFAGRGISYLVFELSKKVVGCGLDGLCCLYFYIWPFALGGCGYNALKTGIITIKATKGEKKMDATKVDMYIMANQKYFPTEKIVYIKEKLLAADEHKFSLLSTLEYREPTTILLISLFLGSFGVDRFMLGDTGMGILKLLTCGVCGIMTIVDWFSVQKKAREQNFSNLMAIL